VCGKACAEGEACVAGSCALNCVGGTTACGDKCVDTQNDPANCGACDTACGSGVACVGGKCDAKLSCKTILASNPASASGQYSIDPDGAGANAPVAVYCDMASDGGGWVLMATLKTANVYKTSIVAGYWNPWSDGWFITSHGTPTNPTVAFSNIDARLLTALVGPNAVLRATTPSNAVKRYHFGFKQADWALWDKSRNVPGFNQMNVNVIGPFNLDNVLVSTSVDLAAPVKALQNGNFYDGTFYLGTGPGAGDADTEGKGARFHVGTSAVAQFGFAGNARVDGIWSLWFRE
jgi:hypothetical protein